MQSFFIVVNLVMISMAMLRSRRVKSAVNCSFAINFAGYRGQCYPPTPVGANNWNAKRVLFFINR